MVNYKMVKDLITKWGKINAHTTSQENQNQREESRAGGGQQYMGFSEMWAGAQKEVELNQRTKSNRKGHIRQLES